MLIHSQSAGRSVVMKARSVTALPLAQGLECLENGARGQTGYARLRTYVAGRLALGWLL